MLHVIRLSPSWYGQTLLGEPLPARWERLGREARVALTVERGEVTQGTLDGRCLAIDAADLRATADGASVAWSPLPDLAALAGLEAAWTASLRAQALAQGVRLVGEGVFLGPSVVLAPGCTIWGPCHLLGSTSVAEGAQILPGAHLTDVVVGARALLRPHTVAQAARIGDDVQVGPFAHLRPGTVLEAGAKVGNFVETKNTVMGVGAKANHLAYLGDCEVGAGANVGAGTITCNYDGARKHRTDIGAGAFVGTNCSLVAPLIIGEGALVAAGSVVVQDVPGGALALGRARQVTKPGLGARILAHNQAKKDEERGP